MADALPGSTPWSSPKEKPVRVQSAATLALLVLASVGPMTARLRAQPSDTTVVSTGPLFTSEDALMGGFFVIGTVAMRPMDRYFADLLQDSSTQANRNIRLPAAGLRIIGYPGSIIIGTTMYAVGRIGGNERMADLGLHGTEAILIGASVGGVLKGMFGRARPFLDRENPNDFAFGRGFKADEYKSFPSGHTVAGFAAAAAVVSETDRWWPDATWYVAPVMYGGAALIGVSRMYNNKHWASDVVMGAAIGTFAGLKVVRYHHSHPDNKIDEWLLGVTIRPAPGGGNTYRLWAVPRRN
jgi:membrane-associated phospholipid phosphatase